MSARRSECHVANGEGSGTKCRLTDFGHHPGMLLERVDYLVLLIGMAVTIGWGFVLLGLSWTLATSVSLGGAGPALVGGSLDRFHVGWPISCTSTWVTSEPSVSSCSAQSSRIARR